MIISSGCCVRSTSCGFSNGGRRGYVVIVCVVVLAVVVTVVSVEVIRVLRV